MEFVNYRHPGPRRVWKVGSELQSTTSDPRDPVDPLDPPAVSQSVVSCTRNHTFHSLAGRRRPDANTHQKFAEFINDSQNS